MANHFSALKRVRQNEKRTEFQTSILQALSLMNGKFTSEVTNAAESKDANQTLTLIAVLDAPFLDTPAKRVETLYLAALSRKPRPEELERLLKYVERGGPSGDTKKALADVFWALLNSSEFILNH
jgi:guanyl-specific ribonuclease Sa